MTENLLRMLSYKEVERVAAVKLQLIQCVDEITKHLLYTLNIVILILNTILFTICNSLFTIVFVGLSFFAQQRSHGIS